MYKLANILVILSFLVGCAAGNKYDFSSATIGVQATGAGALGLAVVDQRPYVLNGDRGANFVGLSRGGFGNPFNVTTASGKPLAEEMQAALAKALGGKGYKVEKLFFSSPSGTVIAEGIKKNGAAKNIVLLLNEWKSDVFINVGLTYDVILRVVDKNSNILAETRASAVKQRIGGAAFIPSKSGLVVAEFFERKIGHLFDDPGIRSELESN